MPSFCIAVPTKDRPDDLARLLDLLVPQIKTRDHVRLVIVNDGSHNDAYQRVIDRFAGYVDYRSLPQSSGPGPARNAAFEGAREDYLICTDDDCLPPADWLAWLEATVTAYPEADILAGLATPAWNDTPSLWQKMLCVPRLFPRPLFAEGGLLTAVGANCVFKRSLFEAAGGYAPEMKGAVEDCYLTQKMVSAGASYGLLAAGSTRHRAETSLGQLWRRFYWYGAGGAQYASSQKHWILASMSSGPSRKQRWASIRRKTLSEWDAPYNRPENALQRLSHTLVTAWTAWAYERGWKAAAEANEASAMPQRPPIFDRFVDFTKSN